MAKKRILILSVRAGAGHMRAAQAVKEALQESDEKVKVRHIDALEYTNKAFRKSFAQGYETLARDLPSLWGILYEAMEKKRPDSPTKKLAALFDRMNARPLRKEVERWEPDAILCTHYMPAEVLGARRKKGKLDAPLSVVLTDYDIHTMWIQEGVDRYFVATEEMAYALREKGVGHAEVVVTGIPILLAFRRGVEDMRVEMRYQLHLDPSAPTVLLSAGGFGLIPIDQTLAALADRIPHAQFLVVTGKNEKLYEAAQKVASRYSSRVRVYGFVDNMHELMAASDVMVAKCGGLTASECLAMGLPLVITKPIPGQEERNADYLLECGAAVRANSAAHIVYKTAEILEDAERRRKMRVAAHAHARPEAAKEIAKILLRDAERKEGD